MQQPLCLYCIQIQIPCGNIGEASEIKLVVRAHLMDLQGQSIQILTPMVHGYKQMGAVKGDRLRRADQRFVLRAFDVVFDKIDALTIENVIERIDLGVDRFGCFSVQSRIAVAAGVEGENVMV